MTEALIKRLRETCEYILKHAPNEQSDMAEQFRALANPYNILALLDDHAALKKALEKIAHPPYGLGFNKLRGLARAALAASRKLDGGG